MSSEELSLTRGSGSSSNTSPSHSEGAWSVRNKRKVQSSPAPHPLGVGASLLELRPVSFYFATLQFDSSSLGDSFQFDQEGGPSGPSLAPASCDRRRVSGSPSSPRPASVFRDRHRVPKSAVPPRDVLGPRDGGPQRGGSGVVFRGRNLPAGMQYLGIFC